MGLKATLEGRVSRSMIMKTGKEIIVYLSDSHRNLYENVG